MRRRGPAAGSPEGRGLPARRRTGGRRPTARASRCGSARGTVGARAPRLPLLRLNTARPTNAGHALARNRPCPGTSGAYPSSRGSQVARRPRGFVPGRGVAGRGRRPRALGRRRRRPVYGPAWFARWFRKAPPRALPSATLSEEKPADSLAADGDPTLEGRSKPLPPM